jgi:hypothetical protein
LKARGVSQGVKDVAKWKSRITKHGGTEEIQSGTEKTKYRPQMNTDGTQIKAGDTGNDARLESVSEFCITTSRLAPSPLRGGLGRGFVAEKNDVLGNTTSQERCSTNIA